MKRYLYIILIIIVIAAIAIGVIFYLKKNPSSSFLGLGTGSLPQVGTQGSMGGQNGGGASGGGNGASSSSGNASGTIILGQGSPAQTFGIVSDGPVLDYFVNTQNVITALMTDGSVISISDGTSTVLSSTTISGIISASFSHDGKKILVSSGDQTVPQTEIFDIASKTWTIAPKGMQSPQWSPLNNDYRIAYLVQTTDSGTALGILDASNLKKSPAVEVALPATDLSLQWIGKSQFVLSDKPSAAAENSIWMFNSSTGKLVPIVYETMGLEAAWGSLSATDTAGLLFAEGNGSPSLRLIDTSGAVIHTLSFSTLPSKCAFSPATAASSSEAYLYCGVPTDQSGFTSAQLPDAYNMMGLFTSDQIESINASSGDINVLRADTAPHVDATDLKVFNNILFFVNRYDHKLYALTLQ